MIHSDFHIHSELSMDSKESMTEACRVAKARGLTEICFTDHHDLDTEGFKLDFQLYLEELAKVREQFPTMRIRSGIELGYDPHEHMRMLNEIALLTPDYFLLSIHAVDGVDPYNADDYFAGRSWAEGMEAYLRAVLEAAQLVNDFNAMAHIGYAARYAPADAESRPDADRFGHPLYYEDAPDLFDMIFDCLIRKEKALEVNTSKGILTPGEGLLSRYRQMGGKLVIMGSDAHVAANIAKGFQEAAAILIEIGFTEYCTFENGKLFLHPLA